MAATKAGAGETGGFRPHRQSPGPPSLPRLCPRSSLPLPTVKPGGQGLCPNPVLSTTHSPRDNRLRPQVVFHGGSVEDAPCSVTGRRWAVRLPEEAFREAHGAEQGVKAGARTLKGRAPMCQALLSTGGIISLKINRNRVF